MKYKKLGIEHYNLEGERERVHDQAEIFEYSNMLAFSTNKIYCGLSDVASSNELEITVAKSCEEFGGLLIDVF